MNSESKDGVAVDGDLRRRPPLRLFEDFVHFSQRQYDCLDYDPFHPMLAHMSKGLPLENALWLSTLYMAFYNIGSAWVAFKNSDPCRPLPDWALKLPIGVQRRNLRGGLVGKHLEDFSRQAAPIGGLHSFLTLGFERLLTRNWGHLQERLNGVWGNGRWGCYTLGELYQKVNRLPATPTDIMNDGSSGPRSGLAYLLGIDRDLPVADLDKHAEQLFKKVRPLIKTRIWYLPEGWYDYGMLESQLCDFNSLRKGNYYIGRDIDRDQERIRDTETALKRLGQPTKLLDEVWSVREAVFDKRYLGEFNGWRGRTEYANTHYQRTGKIVDHADAFADYRRGTLF